MTNLFDSFYSYVVVVIFIFINELFNSYLFKTIATLTMLHEVTKEPFHHPVPPQFNDLLPRSAATATIPDLAERATTGVTTIISGGNVQNRKKICFVTLVLVIT